jgi:hypothetical protein
MKRAFRYLTSSADLYLCPHHLLHPAFSHAEPVSQGKRGHLRPQLIDPLISFRPLECGCVDQAEHPEQPNDFLCLGRGDPAALGEG